MYGLVDGTLLYETLHARLHPIGVTYIDLYNYLGCMGKSPCNTYWNKDKKIRDATLVRAKELD